MGSTPAQDDVFRAWAAVFEVSDRHALGEAHSSWGVEDSASWNAAPRGDESPGRPWPGTSWLVPSPNTPALLAELPDVTRIRTWNADDNLHMLAVNRELGYEPDAWLWEWQKVV